MGGKKKSSVKLPEFQEFPGQTQGVEDFRGLGGRLTSFDFSGDLSPLQDTIDLDPRITELALQQAQGVLQPQAARERQNRVNELSQLGALESSTTSNAFADIDRELQSRFQSIVAGAGLEDRNRALSNRINLFGAGLDTTQSALSLGGNQQAQVNQFNLTNFQNALALEQLNKSNRGGLSGGLTGVAGGALAGFSVGGPFGALAGGALGGVAGAFGPSGTGGQILGAGSAMKGLQGLSLPGHTAGAGSKLALKGIRGTSGRELMDIFSSLN